MGADRRSIRSGLPLLAVIASVLLLAGCVLQLRGEDTGPSAMQIVVSPHPDDEMEGWARITTQAKDLFTVFVVLTGGEETGHCDGARHLDIEYGERAPDPIPVASSVGTASCRAARLDSWHTFLDLAADTLPGNETLHDLEPKGTVDLGPVEGIAVPTTVQPDRVYAPLRPAEPGPDRYEYAGGERADAGLGVDGFTTLPSTHAELWVGEHTARVVLDIGDADVESEEVTWAVRAVLAQRGDTLPDVPLERLVATAYVNGPAVIETRTATLGCQHIAFCRGDLRDLEYEHPDHRAVNRAVSALAGLATNGAWIATYPHDPRRDATFVLTREEYEDLMGLGSRIDEGRHSRLRVGAQQVAFGWLTRGPWRTGLTASAPLGVLFPQVQAFRHVEPRARAESEREGFEWLASILTR